MQNDDIINVYCLSEDTASKTVRESLILSGCKNIEINSAVLKCLDGDVGYSVAYKCDKPFEKVNVLVKKV